MANSLLPKKLARNARVAMKVRPCLKVLGPVSLDKPVQKRQGSRLKFDLEDYEANSYTNWDSLGPGGELHRPFHLLSITETNRVELSILEGTVLLCRVCPSDRYLEGEGKYMKMSSRVVLPSALFASGALGIYVLATDNFLRLAAPTHYEGLAGFVLIDTVLIAALWRQIRFAALGAMLAAIVQVAAMLSDVVAGQPEGVSTTAFATYLLTDIAFVGLMTAQGVIIALSTVTMAVPFVHKLVPHRIGKS